MPSIALALSRVSMAIAGLALSVAASAMDILPYSPAAFSALQAQGKPSALHFHASWCGTCVAQEKALKEIKADPALAGFTVLVVDYDQEKELRKTMKVRSQSVFLVFKGTTEVARSGSETKAPKIKALFQEAL